MVNFFLGILHYISTREPKNNIHHVVIVVVHGGTIQLQRTFW